MRLLYEARGEKLIDPKMFRKHWATFIASDFSGANNYSIQARLLHHAKCSVCLQKKPCDNAVHKLV
jgi:hypothetical protein